ncbi:MAG: DUF4162 domain-containing protein [Sciscionella sp.]
MRQPSYLAVFDHGRTVAEGQPAELKRRLPGGHIRLQFAAKDTLDAAAGLLPGATREEENLTLQVPGAGTVGSLTPLLHRLADASIEVEQLSVHTPDLDDVFFAVTGHPSIDEKETVLR